MHVFQVQVPGDADIVERARQVHARRNGAMHTGVEALQQGHDLAYGALFETHVQIQAAGPGLRPAAARDDLAESVRGFVGARRLAGKLHVPGGRRRGRAEQYPESVLVR